MPVKLPITPFKGAIEKRQAVDEVARSIVYRVLLEQSENFDDQIFASDSNQTWPVAVPPVNPE